MARLWSKVRKRLIAALLPPLRALSPRLAARSLAGIGRAGFRLVPAHRARFVRAVRAWSEHLGAGWDIAALARELAGNELRWLARDLVLDGLSDRRFAALFRVLGREHLDAALAQERGLVLLAAHYGSHMVPAHWLLRRGYPLRLYMERPNRISKFLARRFADDSPIGQARLFISRREASTADSAGSIMRAVKVLRAGMILCLAGDVRWTGPHTAPARFLGRGYSFTATWAELAALTRAPVVQVFCRMARDGTFDLEFLPPFAVPPDAVATGQVSGFVQAFLASVEDQIRRDPANGNEYVAWLDAPESPADPGPSGAGAIPRAA